MASAMRIRNPLHYFFLILATLFVVAPFAWILMSSLKYQIDIFQESWIFTPTGSNYVEVLFGRRSDFSNNVLNSIIVASTSTALVLVIGSLAAYSLHRFAWAKWVSFT